MAYNYNLRTLTQQQIDWNAERSSLQEAVKTEKTRLEQTLQDQKDANTRIDNERRNADALRSQIQDNERKIKALIDAKKKAEASATKLLSEKDTMQARVEAMGKRHSEFKAELQQSNQRYIASVKKLNGVQESLTTLRSFLVPLQGLDDTKRNAIRDGLADLFNSALDLFQSTMYHDISDEIIAGGSFKSDAFPLPASNSAAAKQMRVVAGLAACGKALERHLFRDSFLTDDHELDEQLQLLATTDRLHHVYVRAALAKVLPATQKQVQNRGAEKVISEVTLAIGKWSADEQALKSGLKRICDKAMDCWALAQQIENRIWPDFRFQLSEDWQPLPMPRTCTTPTANPSNSKIPNTGKSQNGAPNREPQQILGSDVVKVVWPTFFAAEPQNPDSADATDQERLHCGYVLTEAQSQKAEEEVSRRAARRTRRADSAPQKKARNSEMFPFVANPTEILGYPAGQPTFTSLLSTTDQLLEQYNGQIMLLILRQISLAVGRHSSNHKRHKEQQFCVVFKIDWNLIDVLGNTYDDGVNQRLDRVICITGSKQDAQLCAVGDYFRKNWPQNPSHLLRTIETLLRGAQLQDTLKPSLSGNIKFDDGFRVATVHGSEDFIVSTAQQLSFLAAVFQEKGEVLSYASVRFSEVDAPSDQGALVFNIVIATEEALEQNDANSCWNKIIGPAVVVPGFPQSPREHDEKGLEISIPAMAAIAGTPQAVTFRGGFVFKARCHALVPVELRGDSVQWHLVDTYPKKLAWSHIDEVCPKRLRGSASMSGIWTRRSFLGWCPDVLSSLATESYNYRSVTYSQAIQPFHWPQVDKLVVGFSQWVAISADITLGKRAGYLTQRPDDYETLLDDARDAHIILYDTALGRAFQTNGEELILHTLHHRIFLGKDTDNKVQPDAEVNLEYIDSRQPRLSVRQVMMENMEATVAYRHQFSDSYRKAVTFKEEVKRLYSTIHGLWAQDVDTTSSLFKLWPPSKLTLSGWEYMDLVKDSKLMAPKSVKLKSSCGEWNQYAKDIKAVVLFGANFGEVFIPTSSSCRIHRSLATDACYLAVQVATIKRLFELQGCLLSQQRLTDSGLKLQGSLTLYRACNGSCKGIEDCYSQRLVRLVSGLTLGGASHPLPLHEGGAVIIGKLRQGSGFPVAQQKRHDSSKQGLRGRQRKERQALYKGNSSVSEYERSFTSRLIADAPLREPQPRIILAGIPGTHEFGGSCMAGTEPLNKALSSHDPSGVGSSV